jgi:TonB-linked SusC/RagA family outer membrane protein
MKKKRTKDHPSKFRMVRKGLLIMKLALFLMVLGVLQSAASVYSQTWHFSMNEKGISIKQVLNRIESNSEFRFFYEEKNVNVDTKVGVDVNNGTIEDVLAQIFNRESIEYKVLDNNFIVLKPKSEFSWNQSEMVQQKKVLTGKVTESSGIPLPGASVSVKGTTIGTITDAGGSYTLNNVPDNATIVFSFVGMVSQELKASGKTSINVRMEEETVGIEEVVAVAYGTTKKKDLTGSISTVDSKLMTTQSNSTITRALEGSVAGVQVSAVDGQPGLDMGIRIRGLGTASQNNSNALIVIDGVPAQNDNPLSTINSKDIENVTILKDAASTALYGSRGANGVVLITTKKGAKGKTKISFEGRWGVNSAGSYQYDKMDDPKDIYEFEWLSIYNSARYGVNGSGMAKNYATNLKNPNMTHEAAAQFASAHLFDYNGSMTTFTRNALGNWMLYNVPGAVYTPSGTGATGSSTMSGAYLVNTDGKLNPQAQLLYKDNYDKYVLKDRLRQEYNVSASGGNEKVDYFLSLGYLEDPSYIRGSQFGRYNGRSVINAQLYDWLKVGTNVAYSWRETQSPATRYGRNPGSGYANVFRYINGQNQLIQLYAHDKDGNIIRNADGSKKVHVLAGDTYSPLGQTGTNGLDTDLLKMLSEDEDTRKSSDIVTRSYAEIKFLKDFTFTTNLGLEKYHETRTRYWNSETGQAQGVGAYGKVYQDVSIINTQQLLNYNHDFGKHHVDGLAGHEFNKYNFQTLNFRSSYELVPGYSTFANFVAQNIGGTFSGNGGNEYENSMESYFGRANYIYDGKYYGEASIRYDGSSKFKYASNRWGTFWSVGGGWRVSSESFMENTKHWLDNLKVRASYGVIGNQNGVSNYSGYQTWGYGATYTQSTTGTGQPATFTLSKGSFVNDGLTWENTNTLDAGIDFNIFSRVHGTFDIYDRNTVNLIWNQPIAYSLGQSSLAKNSAKIQNRGYEVEVSVDIIKKKDLFWSVSLNGTHYTTVLKKVPAGTGSATLNGNWTATADAWSIAGSGSSSGVTYLRGEGKDYYNLYLYKYAGVDSNTGLPLFYHKVTEADHTNGLFTDVSAGGDGKTTNYTLASRYEMGSAIPDWIGGFSTTFKYKDFDFSTQLAYQLGGKFYSVEYGNGLYLSSNVGRALSAELIGNTWTPENTGAKFPMVMYGNTYGDGSTKGSWEYTDMALFSASYLNVKNVTIGYTLPDTKTKKLGISNLRVYVSGDNLWMKAAHSGIDPRMSLVGGLEVGAYAYPSMRTISFGLNLDL